MMEKLPTVSFVIPHRGREEMLRQTLASIAGQQYDLGLLDVAVVSQNEFLAAETLAAAKGVSLQVIHRPVGENIGALRNVGARATRGQFLAFLDADVDVAPNWIVAMRSELCDVPGRGMVAAMQRSADLPPAVEVVRTSLLNSAKDTEVHSLAGANLFLKRETFDKVGGFPEHLRTCEDSYFADQVRHHGKLFFSSRSSFLHLGEDQSFLQMFKKEIWRGQSNLQSVIGRKLSAAELPSLVAPIWYGLFAVASMIAIPWSVGWSLLFLVLAMAPVAAYSLRLRRRAGAHVRSVDIFRFYLIYMTARFFGMIKGLLLAILGKP
ncbi:MAG: glycosyltransferase [Pirellulaceae bacterium]|jgi:glycosyltransferase involved in cell wall biosynthesis